MKMCAAFAAHGNDVTLFGKGKGGSDVYTRYDVPESFKLALSPHLDIPQIGGFVRLAFTLMKAKFVGKANIIYGRDFWTLAAMAGKKVPIMLELHEIPKAGSKSEKLVRKILTAPNLLGLVLISEGLKQDLLAFHPYAEDKILIAHDGADIPAKPITPAALNIPKDTDFQIGYGGSLYPGKGVEIIIEIAKAAPYIGFHICGGPESELQKWKALGLPDNIVFYGHIDQKFLQSHLTACNALIAPYMPKIEINTGADISRWISPLKLFEYMALEKPILCSDLPVLHETMTHKQNALLATPQKIDEWLANIEYLKSDVTLSKSLTDKAFQQIQTEYSWHKRAEKILLHIQDLL